MKIEDKARIEGVILGKLEDIDTFENELNDWLKTKSLRFGGIITDEWEMNYDDELQRRRTQKDKK
ncbi:hypothetical protein E5161_07465 [Cohnella pontilimi]|uniref:Uncharacterized protein n=1 Tax=Cohnella pontilimi TaxID=2564100 RepID=A0A4U0FD41_9BACL|nr:hypothetical protein [Cohnella pontilimi]TJY42680.1 hypothetical protein E5161_07465 [Cohnella pontilimi]